MSILIKLTEPAELVIIEGDFYGSGEMPPITRGCCLVDAQWRLLDSDYSG
jgi:hypothetical protein